MITIQTIDIKPIMTIITRKNPFFIDFIFSQKNSTFRGQIQGAQYIHQSRFTGTGTTTQNGQVPFGNFHINVFQSPKDLIASHFKATGNILYYDMLLDVLSVEGNDTLNTFVKAVLQSELCYAEYIKDPTDANRKEFFVGEKGMGAAIAAYNALGANGQESLDQALKDIYNYYKGIYDEITSSSDNG